MGGDRGQASFEYVALTGLVAVVFAGAAALTSGGLGISVERAIRRGLCELTGSQCPAGRLAAVPNDLAPCPISRSDSFEDVEIDAGVLRLAGRLGLAVERLSDGRVRVSFADTGRIGAGASVGAHATIGKFGAKAEASAEAGAVFSSGRVWLFTHVASAERFIARHAASQDLGGRLGSELVRICPLCGVIAGSRGEPPPPDEVWVSGGLQSGATAGASVGPASAELNATLRGALGHRRSRKGISWFLRLDGQASAAAGAIAFGLDGQVESHIVASIEFDRRGKARRLRLVGEGQYSGRRGLRLPGRLRSLLGASASGRGEAIESEVVIPLHGGDDLRAALAALRAPPGMQDGGDWLEQALDQRATRTLRRFRVSRSGLRIGAGVGLGIHAGVDVQTREEGARLIAAATRLPGVGWLPRADCIAT